MSGQLCVFQACLLFSQKVVRNVNIISSSRHFNLQWALWLLIVFSVWLCAAPLWASTSGSAPVPKRSTVPKPAPHTWLPLLRIQGHLGPSDLGLIINTADPYSVAVGEFYAQARHLSDAQVLRLRLPLHAALTPQEFNAFEAQVNERFGTATQALVLAWRMPYAVSCNSITGALALGYDAALCANTCAKPSRVSPYFGASSQRPFQDLKMRLSMLLAARDVRAAQALIRRGVAADHSLGLRGAPSAHAYFVETTDRARSVRAPLSPPNGVLKGLGIQVHTTAIEGDAQALPHVSRVLIYQTGVRRLEQPNTLNDVWVPGALADHLTSYGGQLDETSPQMSALQWIALGATASYGTVTEPCSHPEKFPHPQLLLFSYMQGSTALEAYWRSVAWPQQGVMVGEPLAAPFARAGAF
jgi:uncharacterized protein (TIGR03790 family)